MRLLDETVVAINAVAHEQNVALSTVWRWAQRGVRGVQLETFAIGGKRYTTREAFGRFVERTTAAASRKPPPALRSERAKQIEAAKNEIRDLMQ
jgi:hypothetical protein